MIFSKKIIILSATLLSCITTTAIFLRYKSHHTMTQDLQKKDRLQEALRFELQAKSFYTFGDFTRAKRAYAQALSCEPKLFTAYCGLGIIAEDHDHNPAAALTFYKKALQINPRHIQTYLRVSDLLERQGNHEKAKALRNHAFTLNERQAWFYEGQNHFWNGKLDAALTCYQQALTLTPENNILGRATILSKMGTVYEKQNAIDAAFTAYKQAVDLCPDREEFHAALSCAYLAKGDYHNWAQEFQWRLQGVSWQQNFWSSLAIGKLWDGKRSLHGKKTLLICENGYGDMLQFIRFAPLLKKQGAHLVAAVQKPLVPLFSRLSYLDTVVAFGSNYPDYDVIVPIESLPYYFPVTAKTIPQPPYLVVEEKLKTMWQEKLAHDKNFKVGICWQTPHDHVAIPQSRRALDPSYVTPLFTTPGVSFYSLQLDPLNESMRKLGVISLGDSFDKEHGSFIDSAAIIHNLDLIITVDTSLAHLAGAFNRPVWVILPVAADVRWMTKATTTPWYPSMKLFRQKSVGDWRPVIQEIKKELEKKVKPKS